MTNKLSPGTKTLRPKLQARPQGWHRSVGRIVYDPKRNNKNNTKWWMVMEVDREITRYFRWMVDRHIMNITDAENYGVLQPSGDAHVSVLRGFNDLRNVPAVERDAMWGKYQGLEVEFFYNPVVYLARAEFWCVDIIAPWLLTVRQEEWDLPSDYGLHLTIGRQRDHWLEDNWRQVQDTRLITPHYRGRERNA